MSWLRPLSSSLAPLLWSLFGLVTLLSHLCLAKGLELTRTSVGIFAGGLCLSQSGADSSWGPSPPPALIVDYTLKENAHHKRLQTKLNRKINGHEEQEASLALVGFLCFCPTHLMVWSPLLPPSCALFTGVGTTARPPCDQKGKGCRWSLSCLRKQNCLLFAFNSCLKN